MPTLEWIGKDKVINHHQEVPFRVLEHKYSFDEDGDHEDNKNSENMIIRGDNLEALKSLLPQFEGKIKCIYIDPPYNTGNEGWIYNDNVNDPKIKKWLGEVVGKEEDDLSRHDKWLCMMYPRLKLLNKLLAEDGAIFISIDDNEQANLKLICNEIFGGNNFIAQIIWQKRTSPDARKRISNGHEYIITYAKDIKNIENTLRPLQLNEKDAKKFKNPDKDPRGPWVSSDFTAQGYRPNQMYTITTPAGVQYTPAEGRCWKNIEEIYLRQLMEGRMWFGTDNRGVPRRKTYLNERDGKNIWTWWPNDEVGHTQEATQELTDIFGSKTVFDYPKPVQLITRIIQIASNKDSIILDSFAGSGTTAHAVMNANRVDGGNRKFILIELMDYADSITADRVKRVISGYSGKIGLKGDFNFYDLGEQLLLDDDHLNEAVGIEKIREYIWYMETKKTYHKIDDCNQYYLGTNNRFSYYFYYLSNQITVLNYDFLATIQNEEEGYIIYADRNSLSDSELIKLGIIFKKIPRDIVQL